MYSLRIRSVLLTEVFGVVIEGEVAMCEVCVLELAFAGEANAVVDSAD